MGISEIAACSGVSPSVIGRHYRDKNEILIELLEVGVEELRVGAGAACSEAGSRCRDQIEAALGSVLSWVAANAAEARLLFLDIDADGPGTSEVRDAGKRWFADRLLERSSPPSEPASLAGEFLVGGIASMLGYRVLAGEAHSAPELADSILALLRVSFDESAAEVGGGGRAR